MEEINFSAFLESTPPGKLVYVRDFIYQETAFHHPYITNPRITLHCENPLCNGERFFNPSHQSELEIKADTASNNFIIYICSNCNESKKTFAITCLYKSGKWQVKKYGEIPRFGKPVPTRAFKLIGQERDLFLMGMASENSGMGIGAFVYYRRVIESQKNRIFDEIIRLAKKINPKDEVIKELELAKNETQFTKAVDLIKHALPQALFIKGHSPLTLLHSALSEGLHAHDDDECLRLAKDVRTVLFEFAERLSEALKEDASLSDAVNRLANKSKKK